MTRWNTLPYELLLKIHSNLKRFNDVKCLIQFELVCKQWNACAPYSAFDYTRITKLQDLSALVMLILRNPKVGAGIRFLIVDNNEETEDMENKLRLGARFNGDEEPESVSLFSNSAQEFEKNIADTYVSLLTILLRHIPKVKSIRMFTESMVEWFDIITADATHLKSIKSISPPFSYRDIPTYCNAAWALQDSLEKLTVVSSRDDTDPISNYLSRLSRRIECFPKLKELRVENMSSSYFDVNSLEYMIEQAPLLQVFEISFKCSPLSGFCSSKLEFSSIDLSTVKPCHRVNKFRTWECVLQNDHTFEYIMKKFPSIHYFEYRRNRSDPWAITEWNGIDPPLGLSPRVQTRLFEFIINKHFVNIYLLILKSDIPGVLSRFRNVITTKAKDNIFQLILQEEFQVIENSAYVFLERSPLSDFDWTVTVHFNHIPGQPFAPIVTNLGQCLQQIIINDLKIDSELLIQIYETCTSLGSLELQRVTINGEIDTREAPETLDRLSFVGLEASSAKWISGITKSFSYLYSLSISDCDITAPRESNRHQISDLHIELSPNAVMHIFIFEPRYSLPPPTCFLFNETVCSVNSKEIVTYIATSGCYRADEMPLEQYPEYESKLSPLEREYGYRIHITCGSLDFFDMSTENSKPSPDFENESCMWMIDFKTEERRNFLLQLQDNDKKIEEETEQQQ